MKKGWEIKRLPDIAEYFIGLTYTPKDVGNEGTIVLRSSNVQNDELDLSDLVRVTCSVKKPLHVRKGDILMCSRNGSKRLVGKTAVIGDLSEEMTFGTFMTVIRSELNPYLSWFFRSEAFREQIGVGENTMINQITKYMLDAISVPVPPLAEQQRIVGMLDEAFEGLAKANANAEKNLQNARALFESHLQSVFTQRGPWWVEKKLEDIADSDCSLSYGIVQPGEEFDEGMPIVRPTDLTTKVIRLGGLKRIDPKLAGGYKRTALQGGELLLCVRGSTGVVSIASPELAGANVTRGIVPIRFNRSLLLPEFGFHLISGGPVQSQIREKTYGTALMQINIRDLRLISLSIPPLQEQKTIAAKLDSLHAETQRLARLYERKHAALEALKKSLLHQAFTGAL